MSSVPQLLTIHLLQTFDHLSSCLIGSLWFFSILLDLVGREEMPKPVITCSVVTRAEHGAVMNSFDLGDTAIT